MLFRIFVIFDSFKETSCFVKLTCIQELCSSLINAVTSFGFRKFLTIIDLLCGILVGGDLLEILNSLIVAVQFHQFHATSIHLVLASCIDSLDYCIVVSFNCFPIFGGCETNSLLIIMRVGNGIFALSQIRRLLESKLYQKFYNIRFCAFGVDIQHLFCIFVCIIKFTIFEEQEGTTKQGGSILSMTIPLNNNSFNCRCRRLFIPTKDFLDTTD